MRSRREVGHGVVVETWADLDGTTWRAQDWGGAQVILRGRGIEVTGERVLAPAFGATGAASGPLGIARIAHSFARGQARAPVALQWLWSPTGARAALVVGAPPP